MSNASDTRAPVLMQLRNLTKHFDVSPPLLTRLIRREDRSYVRAVDGVSLEIPTGSTFSLVGESGCGKSTVARLAVNLYSPTSGRVEYTGRSLSGGKGARQHMQMIFQDPFASLNPRWRVRDIVAEPIRAFRLLESRQAIDKRVGELLNMVNLSAADGAKFPHEFSGGQRQRISIARALASNPEFLICDEPTSALDVSVQAQILNLMKDLQTELNLTYLFISHDLAVVYHISDYVGIMYLGQLVESGPASHIFEDPQHPYTRALLQAVPDLGMEGRDHAPLSGEVPSPISPPSGCYFHPRCPFSNNRCRSVKPDPITRANGCTVRCHAVEEDRLPAYEARYD